jgi:hypothetical protein
VYDRIASLSPLFDEASVSQLLFPFVPVFLVLGCRRMVVLRNVSQYNHGDRAPVFPFHEHHTQT